MTEPVEASQSTDSLVSWSYTISTRGIVRRKRFWIKIRKKKKKRKIDNFTEIGFKKKVQQSGRSVFFF